MDELQISGKRFISARRIARENGYTSDYIGQLIRGGKIVGQKVGRAWYVDAASFSRYLGSEESASASVAAEAVIPVESKSNEAEVPAPVTVREQESEPAREEAEAPRHKETEVQNSEKASEDIEDTSDVEIETKGDVEEKEDAPEERVAPVIITKSSEPKESEDVRAVKETESPQVSDVAEVQRVPLRIARAHTTQPAVASGLRYYVDDLPQVPEIPNAGKESRIIEERADASLAVRPDKTVKSPRSIRPTAAVGLFAAAVAVFIFAAVVSSSVSLNLSIQEGNTAATSYSIGW